MRNLSGNQFLLSRGHMMGNYSLQFQNFFLHPVLFFVIYVYELFLPQFFSLLRWFCCYFGYQDFNNGISWKSKLYRFSRQVIY